MHISLRMNYVPVVGSLLNFLDRKLYFFGWDCLRLVAFPWAPILGTAEIIAVKKPVVIMCPCIYIKRNIVYPLNCVPAKALKAASVHRSITTAFLPDNSSVTVTLLTWQCLRWDANSLHILKTGRCNLHGQKYSWEEAVHRKWIYLKSRVNK